MSVPDPDFKGMNLFGLDPAELLVRALMPVHDTKGGKTWEPPSPSELSKLLPQFQIESLIGAGGMGAVYRGRQVSLDRPVAIKVLPPELAEDEQFVLRFQRESRTLAKLHHPGIVAVYESGRTSEGHLYFVMEFVEGTDLRKILRAQKLDSNQVLEVVCQICNSLQAAHKLGIIHRDIKPENILISNEGYVKLVDFGLSRPATTDSIELTMSNVVMGTPDYMSPEQREGNTDHRTDIYALGILLYEMLTGKPPRGAFDPPSHKVQIDVRLDEIVLKALQEEPDRRYQQVTDLSIAVDIVRSTPMPVNEPIISEEVISKPAKSEAYIPRLIGTAVALALLTGGILVWAPWRSEKKLIALAQPSIPLVGLTKQTANTVSNIPSAPVVGVTPSAVMTTPNPANPDFKLATNDDKISIVKYLGSASDLQIPSSISGLPISSIDPGAFQRCKSLTSVSIPKGITSIGKYAFEENSALSKVTIPESVIEIGQGAFGNCHNLVSFDLDAKNPSYSTSQEGILFTKDLTTIVAYPAGNTNSIYEIPKSVTTIENRAFNGCNNLHSVIIPDTVTSIGGAAFTGCSNLSSLNIPDSVTNITGYAFFRCVNLESCRMPTGLNVIENGLFDGCRKLENIAIPNSVSSIGDSAFAYCSKLKSITFHGNAPIVGTDAFKSTAPDLKIYYKSVATGFTSPFWTDGSGGKWPSEAILPPPPAPTPTPDPITWVHDHSEHMPREVRLKAPLSFPIVIAGESKGSVTAPAGTLVQVTNFKDEKLILRWNDNIQTASLEQTDFIKRAETEMARLAALQAAVATPTPKPLVTIAPPTAPKPSASDSQILPQLSEIATSPESNGTPFIPIDRWVPPPIFPKIKEGTKAKIFSEDAVSRTIYYSKGADAANVINNQSDQSGIQSASGFPIKGNNIILYDTNNKLYKFFPYGRRSSNTSAYEIIDQGGRKMVFYKVCEGHGMWGSDQVTMHYTERIIPLGDNLKLIGVHDQSLIVSDGNKSFFVNNRNTDYEGREISYSPDGEADMQGLLPQGVSNIVTSDFAAESINNQVTITKYLGHASSVNIPSAINALPVVSIGSHTFDNCKLLSIVMPNSITSIRNHAFYCASINNITFSKNLISIENNAFGYCYGLTSVTIPSGVTNIGNYAFEACCNLTSITIPRSVTSIGSQAFTGCGLKNITIPNTLTNIGGGAFSDCQLSSIALDMNNPVYSISTDGVLLNKDMTKVMLYPVNKPGSVYTIPKGVTAIGNNAFDGSKNLIRINIPESVLSIGDSAFVKCRNMTDVMMPSSLISIGDQAFQCCDRLVRITIPSSIVSIGERAFFECKKLKSVAFEGDAPTMGREVFNTTALDFKVTYHSGAVGFSSPTWTDVSGGSWPASEDTIKIKKNTQ